MQVTASDVGTKMMAAFGQVFQEGANQVRYLLSAFELRLKGLCVERGIDETPRIECLAEWQNCRSVE